MADNEAERRGPTIWPWIIGLLLLSLIVWSLMEMYGAASEAPGGARPDTASADSGGVPILPSAPTAPDEAPAGENAPSEREREALTPPR